MKSKDSFRKTNNNQRKAERKPKENHTCASVKQVSPAKLNMALLDWEKAFDKVQHDKLYIAMERLGFSKHYIDVIEDSYMNPACFVRDNFGKSWN